MMTPHDDLRDKTTKSRMMVTALLQKVVEEKPHETELINAGHMLIEQLWEVEISWNNNGKPSIERAKLLMVHTLSFLDILRLLFTVPDDMQAMYEDAQKKVARVIALSKPNG